MTTEAGKRLLAALREHAPWFLGGSAEVEAAYIAAIEAEAVAAERARIAAEVRALTQYAFSLYDDGTDDRITVSRAAVLAFIEEKP